MENTCKNCHENRFMVHRFYQLDSNGNLVEIEGDVLLQCAYCHTQMTLKEVKDRLAATQTTEEDLVKAEHGTDTEEESFR